MRMRNRITQLLGLGLLTVGLSAVSTITQAEKISITQQGAEASQMERPRAGQNMKSVENRYGPPSAIRGPVGSPPITIWDYGKYSVYFEYNHVIHTVLNAQ